MHNDNTSWASSANSNISKSRSSRKPIKPQPLMTRGRNPRESETGAFWIITVLRDLCVRWANLNLYQPRRNKSNQSSNWESNRRKQHSHHMEIQTLNCQRLAHGIHVHDISQALLQTTTTLTMREKSAWAYLTTKIIYEICNSLWTNNLNLILILNDAISVHLFIILFATHLWHLSS